MDADERRGSCEVAHDDGYDFLGICAETEDAEVAETGREVGLGDLLDVHVQLLYDSGLYQRLLVCGGWFGRRDGVCGFGHYPLGFVEANIFTQE